MTRFSEKIELNRTEPNHSKNSHEPFQFNHNWTKPKLLIWYFKIPNRIKPLEDNFSQTKPFVKEMSR